MKLLKEPKEKKHKYLIGMLQRDLKCYGVIHRYTTFELNHLRSM